MNVPLREPATDGVKATFASQLAPAASEAPQLFVWAKSPLAKMPLSVSAEVPTLISPKACALLGLPTATLPKFRVEVEKANAGPVPLPERLTVCGLFDALLTTLNDPPAAAEVAGVKVTLMVQEEPAASEPGHRFATPKPLELLAMLEIATDERPRFFTVTVWAELVVPTAWLPKPRLEVDKLISKLVELLMAIETICGLRAALSVILSVPLVAPEDARVNVALIVQPVPAASVVPHPLD